MVRITALVDNKPSEQKALTAEHGLSMLIEWDGHSILFDCGAGAAPWENARKLGRNVSHPDAVVLSHGHYDHAGGYRFLIEGGQGGSRLFTGPGFFEAKFAANGMRLTDLSAGFDRAFLAQHGVEHREVRGMVELMPGVWLIQGFERRYAFETIPERFVRLTDKGFVRDDFDDEICLALDVGGELAVLVGCSHPGILNMIQTVHERLGMPVFAVFGGTHLVEANEERIDRTMAELKRMGLRLFGLGHCSGETAECHIHADPEIESCHLGSGDCVFLGG